MRTITCSKHVTDTEAEALFAGRMLNDSHYDVLISEDCDVIRDDGRVLLKFRRNIIPVGIAVIAYKNLRGAASANDNRGMAGGLVNPMKVRNSAAIGVAKGVRFKEVKKDGTISRQTRANVVNSGIIGYFDKTARYPYCRQTAFNEKNISKFKGALPFIKLVDKLYADLMPLEYALQRDAADHTSQDFVIRDTAFTTVTVNKNFQTACHKDEGDFKQGFGNLTVLQGGHYEGGYTVMPQFRVAVDVRSCDLLLMDVHEWHGNTAIIGRGNYERVSLVMYYREKMIKCKSAAEELQIAKSLRGKFK
jgi:hypothetical protein